MRLQKGTLILFGKSPNHDRHTWRQRGPVKTDQKGKPTLLLSYMLHAHPVIPEWEAAGKSSQTRYEIF